MNRAKSVAAILLLAALWAASGSSAESSATLGAPSSASQSVPSEELETVLGAGDAILSVAAGNSGRLASPTPLQALSLRPLEDKSITSKGDAAAEDEEKKINIDMNTSARRTEVLMPLEDVYDSGIILDISPEPVEYIPGAISIPYTQFLVSGGILKTVPEMAEILGQAGISRDDSVLIYGECQPCGGGPSAAAYVYWIMKYLGHRNVRLLDGGIDDWVKAGKPTASEALHLMATNYTPSLQADLLASYQTVHSGEPQIIDARSAEEFEAGSIPSSINIPYDLVLSGKKIKEDAALGPLFSSLDKERPVVVYTNTGVKASMIWLALILMDYDAAVYSWKDWQANSASH